VIIDRYILREILKPTVAICTVLIIIYGCYISSRYLEKAVFGQLPGTTVILLILLRAVIALEVLLPTTLYLSVILALGRLYRDSEMMAMFSCGIGIPRILKSVFFTSVIVGMIVAALSVYIRPWAWHHFFELKAQAKTNFDLTRMKRGIFYEVDDGKRVVFADGVDNLKNNADGVFIQTEQNDKLQIMYAKRAEQFLDKKTEMPRVLFRNGSLYEFPRFGNEFRTTDFKTMNVNLDNPKSSNEEYRVKTIPTDNLLKFSTLEEIAELEWRLNAPVATILLALLGVPLSRSSPRAGKYAKVPTAVLIFAGYYYFSAITKKWVGQGVIDVFPGIWWAQILLAGLTIFFLYRPAEIFRR
jgi:lipopolysaccharide export system permease protein